VETVAAEVDGSWAEPGVHECIVGRKRSAASSIRDEPFESTTQTTENLSDAMK